MTRIEAAGGEAATAAPGSAFLVLYDAEYRRSVRTAALTTGSTAIAEEIVQEVFLEMLRRWASIRDPRAYLRRALMSRCSSWLRRLVIERRHANRDPDDGVWHDVDTVGFVDALGRLTPKQRAAIVLRYDAQLSETEIAAALRCRPGTVKSLLSRARNELKEIYRDG